MASAASTFLLRRFTTVPIQLVEVGLHFLRRRATHCVAEALKLARPVKCAPARFYAIKQGRKVAPQMLLHHGLAVLVDAVDLEHVLGKSMPTVAVSMVDAPLGSSGW